MKKTNKQHESESNKAKPKGIKQHREEYGKGFDFHAKQAKKGKDNTKKQPESERTAWN